MELIKNTSRYSHALLASVMMRKPAEKLGEDEEKWEIIGLLHDLDYDLVGDDKTRHGLVSCEMLSGKLPLDCLCAIRSHDHRTGFKPKNRLDEALVVADTLAHIVEKPEGDGELQAETIKKEIKKFSKKQPSYKDNLRKIKELGLKITEVSRLAAESLEHLG